MALAYDCEALRPVLASAVKRLSITADGALNSVRS
jgi:hypothetical protein